METESAIATMSEPIMWVRGKAHYDDGWIVLTEPEEYPLPLGARDLIFELGGVRSPDEAIEFVEQYGLLRHGPGTPGLREPWSEWQQVASDILGVTHLTKLLWETLAGDAESIENLRAVCAPNLRASLGRPAKDDQELLEFASLVIANKIDANLVGAETGFVAASQYGGEPGAFALAVHPVDLLSAIYYELALLAVNRAPLRFCAECGRAFLVHDQRQRYCSPRCANRARYRRFAQKHREPEAPAEGTAALDSE